ncbi:hypothetical protein HMSSN139_43890 [Paenibacillus sp. HMSSN-139]|nr:hypothetical protein HMSSN139_43890 [Paenibacillus sp. HMSSN-139]
MNGYRQAMQELGLAINPQHIVQGSYDYTVESGSKAMEELLKADEKPTAVFAAGDNLAVGAMMAMKRHGLRVPEDISLVGFDDIEMAKFFNARLNDGTTKHICTWQQGGRHVNLFDRRRGRRAKGRYPGGAGHSRFLPIAVGRSASIFLQEIETGFDARHSSKVGGPAHSAGTAPA